MAQISLIYVREDRPKANQLFKVLQEAHLDITGTELGLFSKVPSTSYQAQAASASRSADAIVVLWSHESAKNPSIIADAYDAFLKRTLVTVAIEDAPLPGNLREHDTVDLTRWTGQADDPHIQLVLDAIRRITSKADSGSAWSQTLPPQAPPSGGMSSRQTVAQGHRSALKQPRFDVAFSLADEQRSIIEPVAAELKERGRAVFFHGWAQCRAELAAANLGKQLRQIYGVDSQLVVPVLSVDYARKAWTEVELTVVKELIFAGRNSVMALRVDDEPIEGFSKLHGYLDVRGRSSTEIARLIEMRLSPPESTGERQYVMLSPDERRELYGALLSAFTLPSFDEFLRVRLGFDRSRYSDARDWPTAIRRVVEASEREAWVGELIRGAKLFRPNDLNIISFVAKYPHLLPVDKASTPAPGQNAPSLAGERTSEQLLFLCYRREDTEDAAGRLRDRLADAYGAARVFMDIDSVPLGIDFVEHVTEQIGKCSAVIVLIGKQWQTIKDKKRRRRLNNEGDLVRAEIRAALQQKIPVIPVTVQNAAMPHPEDLPDDIRLLARRNGIELSAIRWKTDVERLIKELDRVMKPSTGS